MAPPSEKYEKMNECVEGRLDGGLEVGAKRNAKAASDGGVGDKTIAGGRKDTPMGEVEEKEDGLGDGLAGKTCLLAKAKSGLDGYDPLCVWSAAPIQQGADLSP